MLKQGQYAPLRVEQQIVLIFAGMNGFLDKLEVNQIAKFEDIVLETIAPTILNKIAESYEVSDDVKAQLGTFFETTIQNIKS